MIRSTLLILLIALSVVATACDGGGGSQQPEFSGTPADAAGLQRGDVMVQMDGEDINNNGDLLRVLAERQSGDTVTATYYRNGEQRETDLTLAERPVE